MTEELLATIDVDDSGMLSIVLEPRCPCGRPHDWLYMDDACAAARRRERVVNDAAIDTSRAIAERTRREELQGRQQMP